MKLQRSEPTILSDEVFECQKILTSHSELNFWFRIASQSSGIWSLVGIGGAPVLIYIFCQTGSVFSPISPIWLTRRRLIKTIVKGHQFNPFIPEHLSRVPSHWMIWKFLDLKIKNK